MSDRESVSPSAKWWPSRKAVGWSLTMGAVVFFLYWQAWVQTGPFYGITVPWVVQLGVHALAIVLVSYGLLGMAQMSRLSGGMRWLLWSGSGLAVAGLVTVHPLMIAGFVLVSIVLLRVGSWLPGGLLLAGSILYAVVFGSGVRLGMEGAPSLSENPHPPGPMTDRTSPTSRAVGKLPNAWIRRRRVYSVLSSSSS